MIRILTVSDAAEFRRVRLQALADHPEAFGMSVEEADERGLEGFDARIAATKIPEAIFGAIDDATLLGFAGFVVHPGVKRRHRGMIWGVYVQPEYRGVGLAESLIRKVLHHASKHVEIVELSAVAADTPARRLYARLGFQPYGLERRAVKLADRYVDLELLSLTFNQAEQA